MRIISGKYKGKKLLTPEGLNTRPTADRAKESIFNILNGYIKWNDVVVYDIFAGSGALGIECLSRGAKKCIFVEKDKAAITIIKKNLDAINMLDSAEFAFDYQKLNNCKASADVVFMDPPYNKGLVADALKVITNSAVISPKTIIIAECEKDETPELPANISIIDTRIYGKAKFLILNISS